MQDRNLRNKSKPNNEKEKDSVSNNFNKLNSNQNNLILKKNSENEKLNKLIGNNNYNNKNIDIDNLKKPNNKNFNTKNFLNPNNNYGSKESNNNFADNVNISPERINIIKDNIHDMDNNQGRNYQNEHENKKIKKMKENEIILNEDQQMIKENSKENKNSNNHEKTETSIYSYANRSTQLDYFSDLLDFIKNEKIKTKRILSKNSSESNKNLYEKILNINFKTTKVPIIDVYKFNFDITIRLTLNKFYNLYPAEFNKIVVENLIFNKNCHLVATFKDHMIFDYVDEFLKRFYFLDESRERIPKISNYYKNYLKFFCNPIFRDFKANNVIQGYGDYKAEMYYNRNYGNKGVGSGNEINFKPIRKKNNPEESQLKKIFDTNAKINIERNSIMTSSNISIKNQIFNESNFKYYIDKKQINKIKYGKFYEDVDNFIDNEKNLKVNNNDFSNVNNSKYTNTLLEFSQFYLNNNENDIRDYNDDISNFLGNVQNDISNIIQYKDLQRIVKEQGKYYEKENKNLINKNLYIGLNKFNYDKEIKNEMNNNIIKNNIEKIVKNKTNEKRNFNSNFNEYETRSIANKISKNNYKEENLYTNRSYEESILSIINIMDIDKDNERLIKKPKYSQNKITNFNKEKSMENKTIKKETTQKNFYLENKKINENSKDINKLVKFKNASNQDFLNNNNKNSIMIMQNNLKVQAKGLNNDNPYIIKKTDNKEKKILFNSNSILNKANINNINSNSNSKSKSDSKTFTDPNNNSNNFYIGVNASKTLHNMSNNTNNSTINLKSYNENEKKIINNLENQGNGVFKPKINSVEIIKNNINKQYEANSNTNKFKGNKIEDNIYYQKYSKIDKSNSIKYLEKSNDKKEKALTINLTNKNQNKINDSILLMNNKFGDLSYKKNDRLSILEKHTKSDEKKNSMSDSNSKERTNEQKLFTTLDPSNLKLNSHAKLSLFSPTDEINKNQLLHKNNEIQNKIKSKNIIIAKNSIKREDMESKNSDLINKLSPTCKNGINFNNGFKTNNNILNYNLYNKTLNANNLDIKKIGNFICNKNFDDTTNTHTKSVEIKANNLKNPSTKTSDIEIININSAQEPNKNKPNSLNPPQISLNYKVNSRNHNSNHNIIKITNSNSNNLGTNTGTNGNPSMNNLKLDSENYQIINNLRNSNNQKYNTTKTQINLVKPGMQGNNFPTNSSINNNIHSNNLTLKDKVKKVINSNPKNFINIDKNFLQSDIKSLSKENKRFNENQNRIFTSSYKTTDNYPKENILNKKYLENNNNNNYEYKQTENSNWINANNDETYSNMTPEAIEEINNNIIINNPNILNKPNALTDIMKITLSFYMDKASNRINRPISNSNKDNSSNNIINNQFNTVNGLNDSLKKTTIINKIDNLNKFNININNQFNLGDLNSINAQQLEQLNNIANLNPSIFINSATTNNNINKNNNGILEYNSKKQSQNKTMPKPNENNLNNQFNYNNNLSNNISSTTHNGKMSKFNEKSQNSEIMNYGNPIEKKNNNYSENVNYRNNEASSIAFNNNFNKTANLENNEIIFDKKQTVNKFKINNSNFTSLNQNANGNANAKINNFNNNVNNNLNNNQNKLTFSQDINSLKNMIEKNKILSRNKNQNLFKISSNQNMTKPGIISEEDISTHNIVNAKTNFNYNYNNTNSNINLNSGNKNSSVFLNAIKNQNSSTGKSEINLLKDNNMQIKAFNSYAHKEKEITNINNPKKFINNKSPHLITTEGNQLLLMKKTYDDKSMKLAISKLKVPSPSSKMPQLTSEVESSNKIKINQSSNKKPSFGSLINNGYNSTKENLNSKINFNTNLKNLKISFDNKNISGGEINNNKLNNNNHNHLNLNMINQNNNLVYNSMLKSKEFQIDNNNLNVNLHKNNSSSNKNSKKIVIMKK